MKSLLISTALLFGYGKSEEYVSNVPEDVAGVYAATGQGCMMDSDCYDLFPIPDAYQDANEYVSSWMCVNDTMTLPDNSTDTGICLFMGCEDMNDCADDNLCMTINICDEDHNFVDSDYMLYSKMCMEDSLCTDIKVEANWTDDTMCYYAEDNEEFYSEEEGVICGNTCIVSENTCIPSDNDAASDCKDDETCCTSEGWDEAGCAELLITVYLIYTIIVAVVICFCCLGCCCLCYKKRKGGNAKFEDDMDTTTNHYNVYI